MDELKRCPFCGSLPRTEIEITKKGGCEDHVDFRIHCAECGVYKSVRLRINAYCHFVDAENAMNSVIELWNRRTDADMGGEQDERVD